MNPRTAEFRSSLQVVSFRRCIFLPDATTIKRIAAEVRDAIVSIGRMSSSRKLILKAVGTVDQNKIARPA
jgi:hypothetical protein